MTSTPLQDMATALQGGHDYTVQFLGDSTVQGLADPADPNATLHGWVGRLGVKIGTKFDVNVHYLGAPYPGSTVWNGYSQDEMLNVATQSGRPTLKIVNGSMGGARAAHLNGWITNNNLIPNPADVDLVITGIGFNDLTWAVFFGGASVLQWIQSLIATVRGAGVTAPIIWTSQNRSMGKYTTDFYYGTYSSITTYYVGNPLNLTPPIQGSTTSPGIWCLDTQQAFPVDILGTLLNQNDSLGGLHPNGAGYQAEADWIFILLGGGAPDPALPVITTNTLTAMTQRQAFSQTLTATGAAPFTWTVQAGALPDALVLDADTGQIHGTPSLTATSYDVTIRCTNTHGDHVDKHYQGTVAPALSLPFIPITTARVMLLHGGFYYPLALQVRRSGVFEKRPIHC